jgi:hypothetical protein
MANKQRRSQHLQKATKNSQDFRLFTQLLSHPTEERTNERSEFANCQDLSRGESTKLQMLTDLLTFG